MAKAQASTSRSSEPPEHAQSPASEAHSRTDVPATDTLLKSYKTSLLLLLTAYQTHFRSLGYIKDSTLELLDRTVSKRTVTLTVRDSRAREALGTEAKLWTEFVEVFRNAIASLDGRCYADIDAPAGASAGADDLSPYDAPCSNVIVANSATLVSDLYRLDALMAIARNVLTAGEKIQNLAAQTGFDREVCGMINLAVKVTARGFDGDGGQSDEERFLEVSNGFKKILITSLQFLSNLVTMNERLKLMLWVELFDSTLEHGTVNDLQAAANSDSKALGHQAENVNPTGVLSEHNAAAQTKATAPKTQEESSKVMDESTEAKKDSWSVESQGNSLKKPTKPVTPYLIFLGENREVIREYLREKYPEPTTKQIIQEGTRRWNDMPDKTKNSWRQSFQHRLEKYQEDLAAWKVAVGENTSNQPENADQPLGEESSDQVEEKKAMTEEEFQERLSKELEMATMNRIEDNHRATPAPIASREPDPSHIETLSAPPPPPPPADTDFRIIESASDGIKKLEEGKVQLLKRLDSHESDTPFKHDFASSEPRLASPASPSHDEPMESPGPEEDGAGERGDEDEEEDGEYFDSEEDDESSVEDDDDEYGIPGEDGRGLLTDVPLILGPNEIEVLPMLIMSGIVADWKSSQPPSDTLLNMYTIRCHLLLAQENGRNLLRELLIFVAAWDLREEELYFKFMVKIIEAILLNGLMPFAYGAFKENKDIISPAQAVIMKLLTKIFHSRQAYVSTSPQENPIVLLSSNKLSTPAASDAPKHQVTNRPPRPDIQTVHFLFTEFRTTIIPQICALIFLQGQIRIGHAQLDDFPLNLWDMERMYEGVYQYLEFFAILTDHDEWKERMAEWEVVSELVTLLRELDAAIPKKTLTSNGSLSASQEARARNSGQRLEQQPPGASVPVAVERPYDVSPSPHSAGATSSSKSALEAELLRKTSELQSLTNAGRGDDADGTLRPPLTPPAPPPAPLHDEPADFEWRNLKKLCVLVLSSLVWKNKPLQDQVRRFGGIHVLLSCCSGAGGIDEHNPYIREHAIMCLRFLIEGNEECAAVVRELSEKSNAREKARAAAAERQKQHAEGSESSSTGGTAAKKSNDVAADPPNKEGGNAADETRQEEAGGNSKDDGGNNDDEDVIEVPHEVLDHHGYETFMDAKGQVGLRRKELASSSFHTQQYTDDKSRAESAGQARSQTQQIPPPKNPAQLPEWMQMVMKSLPRADGIPGAQGGTGRSK